MAATSTRTGRRSAQMRPGTPDKLKVLFTSFGWVDDGGGTVIARLLAEDLRERGHEVAALYASTQPLGTRPYRLTTRVQSGVTLHGVHNRPSPILDLGHPERDVHQAPVRRAFANVLDRFAPDVVHCHNLHNLGADLLEETGRRGIPVVLTPHNYWFMCARAHLEDGHRESCDGPDAEGTRCARCVGEDRLSDDYRRRTEYLARAARESVTHVAAPSAAIADAFALLGAQNVSVVRQTLPSIESLWTTLGERRVRTAAARTLSSPLVIAALGSARTHKGLLQLTEAVTGMPGVRVDLVGSPSPRLCNAIRRADTGHSVRFTGSYTPDQLAGRVRNAHCAAILSTVLETGPLSAIEAFAAGLPVIASAAGGTPECVRDGVDGLVVAPRSVMAIRHAVSRVRDDPDLLATFQGNIRPPARWADFVDEVESLYRGRRGTHTLTTARSVRWVGDGHPDLRRELRRSGLDVSVGGARTSVRPMLPTVPHIEVRQVSPELTSADCRHPHRPVLGLDLTHPGAASTPVDIAFGRASLPWTDVAVSTEAQADAYVRYGVEPTGVHLIPTEPHAAAIALRAALDTTLRRHLERIRPAKE